MGIVPARATIVTYDNGRAPARRILVRTPANAWNSYARGLLRSARSRFEVELLYSLLDVRA